MSDLRPISIDGFSVSAIDFATGHDTVAPELRWLPIRKLVVDDRYQRPITHVGRTNIRRIAAQFAWAKFSPVIAAPLPDDLFALIDGQHRSTAALLRGYESVPALVVALDLDGQAASFAAVNGVVTKTHILYRHAARVVAGDPAAVEIDNICAIAGVRVCRHPVPSQHMREGDTVAIGALYRLREEFGRDRLITALQCVTETSNNAPGMLRAPIIAGLCIALRRKEWLDAGEALFAACDDIDFEELAEKSWGRSGGNVKQRFAELVEVELARRLIRPQARTA